jgi:hypothetical protein
VEVTVDCVSCQDFTSRAFTTYVGPRALETASTNGALFVQVFDAEGQPVSGADVHIENNQTTPSIVIDDTTDNNGFLQIIDAPPGVNAYEVSVSKTGYSSDQSYTIGDVANPNPSKPHTTVVMQQVSQTSFAIDKTSTLEFTSMTNTCAPIGGIDFDLTGAKLIGTSPDIPKSLNSYVTNGSGRKTLTDVEWDTYSLDLTDTSYSLAGTIPSVPFIVNPDSSQSISLVVVPGDARMLMVTVKDTGTRLPLSGATVELEDGGVTISDVTGRGFLTQTDWTGGSGQSDFTDLSQYFSDDGNIEYQTPGGELQLRNTLGTYQSTGELTSSTFDTGTTSNFQQILWQPLAQVAGVGENSVRFQIATNNDNITWDFKGPDGTSGTYYDLTNQDISTVHNGDRYLRYKLFLQTADTAWTPIVSDISFTYTSACTPPGQVLFRDLDEDTYTMTVTRSGYQDYSTTVSVTDGWQSMEALLVP